MNKSIALLEGHRLPEKLITLYTRLKMINEKIAVRVTNADIDVEEDFLLFGFYEQKLLMLENILTNFPNEDFRVLPTYLPQYLDILGKISRFKNQQEKENARFTTFKKVLAILETRSTRLIIDLMVKRYFEENQAVQFPTDLCFGRAYSARVKLWHYETRSTIDLLKEYCHYLPQDSETAKSECKLIHSVLDKPIRNIENTESFLTRQAAVVLIHLELSYSSDQSNAALSNLSMEVSRHNCTDSFSSTNTSQNSELEQPILNELLSLYRVAKLMNELNQVPSTIFFCKVLDCYLQLCNVNGENDTYTQDLPFTATAEFAFFRTIFSKTDAKTIRVALDQYFGADDKATTDKIIKTLLLKTEAGQAANITWGLSQKTPTKRVQTPVYTLSDATNIVKPN